MKVAWSKRQQQCVAAVGGLALVLLVLYALFLAPVVSISQDYAQQLSRKTTLLAGYQGQIAMRDSLEALLARIESVEAQQSLYFTADTPALVATELQQQLDTMVKASGGEISSIQVRTALEAGPFFKVPISVHMVGNSEFLQEVLHRFENSEKLLTIDKLTVHSRQIRARRRTADPEEGRTVLNIQADVAGYMRREVAE